MNCLCLLQANSNPSVTEILTTAAPEQNDRVFAWDKECREPATGQLHFSNRSFVYNAIKNSISILYLLLSITTFLLPKEDRQVFDESSTSSINLPNFKTAATGTRFPAPQHRAPRLPCTTVPENRCHEVRFSTC